MYSPYSSSTQRNKSRLYVFLFLIFVGLIIYWRYSSTPKRTFQSAGQQIDSAVQQGKDKVNDAMNNAKDKVDDTVDAAKDKARKVADTVEQAAADAKKKI